MVITAIATIKMPIIISRIPMPVSVLAIPAIGGKCPKSNGINIWMIVALSVFFLQALYMIYAMFGFIGFNGINIQKVIQSITPFLG